MRIFIFLILCTNILTGQVTSSCECGGGSCIVDTTIVDNLLIDCRTVEQILNITTIDCVTEEVKVNKLLENSCNIFLMGGQSGMVGRGQISEVTDPSILVSSNVIQWWNNFAFVDYAPTDRTTFGPELGIYESILNDPNAYPTYIIKQAFGATPISWHIPNGARYDRITEEFEQGIAAAKADGCENPIVYYFWYQGENDGAIGSNYDSLFQIHYDILTSTLGNELHFVATQIADVNANYTTVNDVFINYANNLSNFDFVEIEYNTTNYIDNVHIGTEAQLEVGREYYNIVENNCSALINEDIAFP